MTIKNNNEDGQTGYVERYMTDRWFSRILEVLGRSYVLRHPRNTCASWIWIDWSKGCMKVEGHLLACSKFWWFCWKQDLWKKDSIALTLCSLLHSYTKSAVSFDMYSQQFTLYVIALSKAFFFVFAFRVCLRQLRHFLVAHSLQRKILDLRLNLAQNKWGASLGHSSVP